MAKEQDKKPFLIIEIAGGLGNQMFQYAFYLKMKSLGYPCKLYYDKTQQKHNGYELKRVFGIDEPFASEAELDEVLDREKRLPARVRRKIVGHKPSFYWEHDKGYAYKPEILDQTKTVYLQGCWLSEKYFSGIEEQVRDAFSFKNQIDGNPSLKAIDDKPYTASVHIRRGDYLQSNIHRNLNYTEYIEQSFRKVKRYVAERDFNAPLYFYVFSDDLDFANSLFKGSPWKDFVIYSDEKDAGVAMQLMSRCKFNIIANSTFSWWAAWLNANPDKIVISPKDWFTDDRLNDNDIVPETWIRI